MQDRQERHGIRTAGDGHDNVVAALDQPLSLDRLGHAMHQPGMPQGHMNRWRHTYETWESTTGLTAVFKMSRARSTSTSICRESASGVTKTWSPRSRST